MFTTERLAITSRMSDVRLLLELIKRLESDNPLVPDTAEVQMLRGLFFVHLYAILEFGFTTLIQSTLRKIHSFDVEHAHLKHVLHTVALDSLFTSYKAIGTKGKWGKRLELLNKMVSNDKTCFNDTVFSQDLQNVWVSEISKVFSCLGLDAPVVPEARLLGYVDEIVDKRNKVAHGRETPADVAAGMRSNDLEIRLQAISQTIYHIADSLEDYISNLLFVMVAHRETYRA